MPNNAIEIDFITYEYLWKSVRVGDFTNLLKDEKDFAEQFRQLQKLIKYIRGKNIAEIKTSKHCHVITGSELGIIKNIIKAQFNSRGDIFEKNWNQKFDGEDFWQFGVAEGLRIIGTLNNNKFMAVFFDYYHLLYPDKGHNDKNVSKNDFNIYDGEA